MARESITPPLRCFVAIASPIGEFLQPLIGDLEKIVRKEKYRLRISAPENLHITLKFIGDVDVDQVGLLDSVLRNQSAKQSALHLSCCGLGQFENALYLGIKEDDCLNRFVENLNDAFAFLGYSIEYEAYLPHITIARFDSSARKELAASLEKHSDRKWCEIQAKEIHLFSSQTLPDGARYTSIQSYPLLT